MIWNNNGVKSLSRWSGQAKYYRIAQSAWRLAKCMHAMVKRIEELSVEEFEKLKEFALEMADGFMEVK